MSERQTYKITVIHGNGRTRTSRAFNEEEFHKILDDLKELNGTVEKNKYLLKLF